MNTEWLHQVDVGGFDTGQALIVVMLWMMAAMGLLGIIYAFLILRQAQRMARVLPTPITPAVKVVAWAYLLLTVVIVGLIVNFLVLGVPAA